MEWIAFYEFLPTKAKELEMGEKGSSSTPPFCCKLIRRGIRKSPVLDFLRQLELQQYIEPQEDIVNCEEDDRVDHQDDRPPQEWPIAKVLTKSDVGHLSRLVLQRNHVATFFSLWPPSLVQKIAGEELQHPVVLKDIDTGLSEHQLVFRRWSSNRMYVLQSRWHGDFVRRRRLREGDQIGLSWNSEDDCFMFSVLGRA